MTDAGIEGFKYTKRGKASLSIGNRMNIPVVAILTSGQGIKDFLVLEHVEKFSGGGLYRLGR